jgi:hypothetical protein
LPAASAAALESTFREDLSSFVVMASYRPTAAQLPSATEYGTDFLQRNRLTAKVLVFRRLPTGLQPHEVSS